jgi:hypothetical protein
MAIKLVLLKSGEDVICDLTNMEVGEGDDKKVVGYYLGRPCLIDAQSTGTPNEFTIQLKSWTPLARNPLIPVSAAWVVTVLDPVKQLYDVYKKQVMEPKGVQEWMGRAEEGSRDYLDTKDISEDPYEGMNPEEWAIKQAQKLTEDAIKKYGHGGEYDEPKNNQDSSTDESTDSDN